MSRPAKQESELVVENAELRAQLEEAQETLRAIQGGEVDALVVGERVYSLEGSETPYRVVLEEMAEGAAMLSADGTVLYANRSLARLLKTPLESLMGTPLRRFVAEAERPAFQGHLAESKRGSSQGELSLRCEEGGTVRAQVSFSGLETQPGRPMWVVVMDLTERKRAEEALQRAHDTLEARVLERTAAITEAYEATRASQERYRLLFQSVQEGFYLAEAIFDSAGQCVDAVYLDVNPAFEWIMGRPRQELIGKRIKELVPQLQLGWLEVFGTVTRTGEPARHDAYSGTFQRHFEAYVFRPKPGQFGCW